MTTNLQGEMTRRKLGAALMGAWIAGSLALFAAPALAAPQYKDSEPNDKASLQAAPAIVSVTFSEPLDDSSTLAVENACGEKVDNGSTVVDLNEMRIDVTERHYSGTYTVRYAAIGLGGVTGTTNGSFSFTAAEGHNCKSHGNGNRNDHDDHDDENDHGDGHGDGDHGDRHGDGDHGDHEMDGSTHSGDHDMNAHDGHGDASMGHGHDGGGGGGHGGGHGEHGRGNEKHGGGEHDQHGTPAGDVASGPLPELPADGRALLLALTLCAGMGVVGGVFLRTSG